MTIRPWKHDALSRCLCTLYIGGLNESLTHFSKKAKEGAQNFLKIFEWAGSVFDEEKNLSEFLQIDEAFKNSETERKKLFGDKNVSTERENLSILIEENKKNLEEVKNDFQYLKDEHSRFKSAFDQKKKDLSETEKRLSGYEADFDSALKKFSFKNEAEFENSILTEEEFQNFSQLKKSLETQKIKAESVLEKAKTEFEDFKKEFTVSESKENLLEQKEFEENPMVDRNYIWRNVKQELQSLIFSMNQPFRGGLQSGFYNISLYDKEFLDSPSNVVS